MRPAYSRRLPSHSTSLVPTTLCTDCIDACQLLTDTSTILSAPGLTARLQEQRATAQGVMELLLTRLPGGTPDAQAGGMPVGASHQAWTPLSNCQRDPTRQLLLAPLSQLLHQVPQLCHRSESIVAAWHWNIWHLFCT